MQARLSHFNTTLRSAASPGQAFHAASNFFHPRFIKWTQKLHFFSPTAELKAQLSHCVHETNKETCAGPLISQARKQTHMQKPCDRVRRRSNCVKSERANNKRLFSEGQQSQRHHQLDSRAGVVFPFILIASGRESDSLPCDVSAPLKSAAYIMGGDDGNTIVFWRSAVASEGV